MSLQVRTGLLAKCDPGLEVRSGLLVRTGLLVQTGLLVPLPHVCCEVPVNDGDPVIEGGNTPGEVVIVDFDGAWLNDPTSFTYQWFLDGVPIEGETSDEYVIQEADVGQTLTVQVTAHNACGASAPATSNGILIEAAGETDRMITETGDPMITEGAGDFMVTETTDPELLISLRDGSTVNLRDGSDVRLRSS